MFGDCQRQLGKQAETGLEPQAQREEKEESNNMNTEEQNIEQIVDEEGENQESVTQSDNLRSETELEICRL